MLKKYQVFVSSTYEDLREHRQEIMHALLELDCIPSGMELFPAADEDQWTLIKGVIDDCDYYIVVIGGRYGTIGPDGLSYTEMEYRYAVEREKPVIAFLHKAPETIQSKDSEQSDDGRRKLEEFRKLAQKKMCKYWATPQELGSVVSRSLVILQKNHPGVGWVRADETVSPEAAAEILRLREQIDKLRDELHQVDSEQPRGTENLAQGDDKFLLRCEFLSNGPTADGEETSYTWTWDARTTWNQIFFELSPLMLDEAATAQLRSRLTKFATGLLREQMPKVKSFKGHDDIRRVEINESHFETVLVQLNALGLISQSTKARSIKASGTFWTLTKFGRNITNRLRAITRDGS